ncbi:MAG: hypothetical protein P8I62_08655, partial [Pseudomonadales bacterium]|nr:hypothetical protein [Pseudomonadales bacterium]
MILPKRCLRFLLLLLSIPIGLIACSGGSAPESSSEYAIQGLYSASLSADGAQAIVGSINHGSSLWRT